MPVYSIEADLTGRDIVKKRDALGKAIAILARKARDPDVFFHELVDPVGGAPVILLECSEAFLELVKKLPEFRQAGPIWAGVVTRRSEQLWDSFSAGIPPKPTPPRRGGPTP